MFEAIRSTVVFLNNQGIPTCLVGELALCYYNVPRVINEIEIAVPASSLTAAVAILENDEHQNFLRVAGRPSDIYNNYKSGYPVFKHSSMQSTTLVIGPDEVYGLNIHTLALPSASEDSCYSKEILEEFTASEIAQLPFPPLEALLYGLCRTYTIQQDMIIAAMAEQLVDGVNINASMCTKHLSAASPESIEFAIRLANGRSTRSDQFRKYDLTCYVSNEDEVRNLMRIPGHFAAGSAAALHLDCCLREDDSQGVSGGAAAKLDKDQPSPATSMWSL